MSHGGDPPAACQKFRKFENPFSVPFHFSLFVVKKDWWVAGFEPGIFCTDRDANAKSGKQTSSTDVQTSGDLIVPSIYKGDLHSSIDESLKLVFFSLRLRSLLNISRFSLPPALLPDSNTM